MAYDINFPADDSYLSDFPAGDREQNRALKDDQIVNAGRLRGLTVGNENGQIPINNGTENTNLNAALLNGKASSYFATSNHTHTTATQSSNGYISNADKKKLDGIASGAEVNQNAFANVKVGSTTIQSDAKQDTLELAAGTNISLVGDANNDKVTIAVTGKVASATTANKVNNTATNGSAIDLVAGTMASSDNFRIRIGGSNDAGYAEIATADNGNEPIYIRQYGPGFTTATRTATILDGSGNTSFPGTVTAPNFNGKATKATQDSDGNTITSTYLKRNPSAQNDMNACTVQGIYRFDGQLKNAWTSTSWGTLLVFNNNYNGGSGTTGTYLVQMAFPTDGRIWTRQRVNTGAWESWYCTAYTYSPAFSGSPTAPTPATTDNSTRVATTAYVKNNISETLKKVYPVGSIYMSTVSTNPATLFGFGTWEAMPAGRVLLAQGKSSWGTTYNAGSTGGEATHQLTVGEIPNHNHTGSINTAGEHTHSLTLKALWGDGNGRGNGWAGDTRDGGSRTNTFSTVGNHTHTVTINSTGSGQPHNNLQPYISVYMWKRTV
ncbi:phage baseplate protein [Megamonas funiformis]|uniref:phage tail protein n=2 Tax=Megamonas funiformis TaxID=437897 RepID=UPI0039935100